MENTEAIDNAIEEVIPGVISKDITFSKGFYIYDIIAAGEYDILIGCYPDMSRPQSKMSYLKYFNMAYAHDTYLVWMQDGVAIKQMKVPEHCKYIEGAAYNSDSREIYLMSLNLYESFYEYTLVALDLQGEVKWQLPITNMFVDMATVTYGEEKVLCVAVSSYRKTGLMLDGLTGQAVDNTYNRMSMLSSDGQKEAASALLYIDQYGKLIDTQYLEDQFLISLNGSSTLISGMYVYYEGASWQKEITPDSFKNNQLRMRYGELRIDTQFMEYMEYLEPEVLAPGGSVKVNDYIGFTLSNPDIHETNLVIIDPSKVEISETIYKYASVYTTDSEIIIYGEELHYDGTAITNPQITRLFADESLSCYFIPEHRRNSKFYLTHYGEGMIKGILKVTPLQTRDNYIYELTIDLGSAIEPSTILE